MTTNQRIVLASRPQGEATVSNFRLDVVELVKELELADLVDKLTEMGQITSI